MATAVQPEIDYFTDHSILVDPYEYFQTMFRERGPIYQLQNRDILMVTGFEECLEVFRNTEDFSAINCVASAAHPLPFEPEGDDIGEELEAHRDEIPGGDLMITFDGEQHSMRRALLNRLFVPSRLKANEDYMNRVADKMAAEVVAKGECELISEIATPFVTYVIADLLGVPAEDRESFREIIDSNPPPGSLDNDGVSTDFTPLIFMGKFFYGYLVDRRANPRDDILSELAAATYPDGTVPEIEELVRLATFLFGAGQDTSAKLIGNSIRFLSEMPEVQDQVRADLTLVPDLIEEVLRLEGSSKNTFRVARHKTRIGDVEVPAGKRVVLAMAAANRDPRRWEDPDQLKLGRPRIKEHIAFGRGAHVCAGAPLGRAEARVMLEHLLKNTSSIALDESKHGPRGARRLDYEPSFVVRGLTNLHVKLTPR